jgi:hypothetical protein
MMKTPIKLVSTNRSSLLILTLSALCGFGPYSRAVENAVLLEGFETNLDAITVLGSRATISTYVATAVDDASVTQGKNSMEVEIAGTEFWGEDLKITFSDELSAKIREAALSPDVARYILRWDFIFPPSGTTAWMNSQAFLDGVSWFNDQLDSNNGKLTMSVPLDLISTNLPTDVPVSIRLADNFDASEDPFTSFKVHLDNFRLVDTYATGTHAVTYPLQSFEEATNSIGGATNFTGWGGGQRTTYSQYTAQSPDDVRVSDGTHSLKVTYSGAGTWGSDFIIPFAGTKLAEVLKLDEPADQRPTADELAKYTLRFEVVYPPQGDDWTANWMNTSFQTLQVGFPWSQSGTLAAAGTLGFSKTYSITLDQIPFPDWADPKPAIMFIANGAWGPSGTDIYYDNFRLIYTGGSSAARPNIDSITVNAQGKVVISWTGAGSLQWAPSLSVGAQWNPVAGAVSGSPIDPPAGGIAFYRILAQ